MPAYDLIIRNGTIVDGTGQDRFTGDIAVKDGLIAQVGEVSGDAAEEIDAHIQGLIDATYREKMTRSKTEASRGGAKDLLEGAA